MLLLCLACTGAGPTLAATLGGSTIAGAATATDEGDTQRLASYRLIVPVLGTAKRSLIDTYSDRRGGHSHEALDIAAPRGTQVVAAGDGRVVKLFRSVAGGLTVYQFDPSERYAYYYAHLDKYAQGLAEGMMLKRGDPIGAVGSTGNASPEAPHLHFAVFKLGPEKQWWKGSPINPFPLLN
jgi:murein DD-endopeptidase MepM/ murein hydrolase activator NlpD